LFDDLTVEEHLNLCAAFKGMEPKEIPDAVFKMIEHLDLKEKTH
jgi:ABC-type multidrug transport system ATPase subunit